MTDEAPIFARATGRPQQPKPQRTGNALRGLVLSIGRTAEALAGRLRNVEKAQAKAILGARVQDGVLILVRGDGGEIVAGRVDGGRDG